MSRCGILTSKNRAGSVMLEFVLTFPLVLVLMLACIQFAQLWTAKQMVHYAAYCAARAALVGKPNDPGPQRAAEIVCAWTVLGEGQNDAGISIPGWGRIPGSGAAQRKTQATIQETDWNVCATVEHDYALIVPIVGPMLAWGLDPWNSSAPWSLDQQAVNAESLIGDKHRLVDVVNYPHLQLTETVWLPKPYKVVIAAGN